MAPRIQPRIIHPVTRTDRIVNGLVGWLLRLGQGPALTYRLTVPGRRTGQPHTVPVTLVEYDGQRWLVAPRGAVSWTRNLRAVGRATLERGRQRELIIATEVPVEQRPPILKQYVTNVPITRRYFQTPYAAPAAAFAAEAADRPVFLVQTAAAATRDGYRSAAGPDAPGRGRG